MSCNCRAVCFHYSPREALTSLEFGVFLFAFAYFLAFTPLPYLSAGVTVMADAAVLASDAFGLFANAMNHEVASLVQTQLVTAEAMGVALALIGNTIGEGAARFVTRPDVFRERFSLNMRTLVRAWSPAPVHQYQWAKSHRFWTGNPKMVFLPAENSVAVLTR